MNKHKNIDPYDEEIWEEEDEIDEEKLFILNIDDIKIESFNHNIIRGRYGEVMTIDGGEKIIIFKNPFNKEKFLKYLGYRNNFYNYAARNYKKDVTIKMIDKNINLYGVFFKSFNINEVNIRYDYFKIINK